MPSWPAVIVGAAVLGIVVGAAQKDEAEPALPAPEPVEASTQTPPDSPNARDSAASPAPAAADPRWPTGVMSTLPGETEVPRIALTFDDGPHPRWTPQVLDVLARYDATATFCVVGDQIVGREAILARIHREGHVLCNHSMTHDYGLGTRDPSRVTEEIDAVTRLIAQAVPDADVTAFRAPGGRFAPDLVDEALGLGLDSWGWSLDAADWNTDDPDEVVTTVLDEVGPAAVVLMHDGGGDRSATVAALTEIIPVLASVGYEFVGLPDLP